MGNQKTKKKIDVSLEHMDEDKLDEPKRWRGETVFKFFYQQTRDLKHTRSVN